MREDLEAARRVHAKYGLELQSFVFPRNQVAHLDLLATAGVRVFRSPDAGWPMAVRRRAGRWVGGLAHLMDKITPIPPPTISPRLRDESVVDLPGSMLLLGRSGVRRLIRPEVAEAKARLGVRDAQRTGRIFHLWFHPSNFYEDTDTQFHVLEGVLRAAAAARAREQLEIKPMKSFAAPSVGTDAGSRP
jgi:hypothetical protein